MLELQKLHKEQEDVEEVQSLLSHTEADNNNTSISAPTTEEEVMSQQLSLPVIIGIISNILCVVGIVITNKYIIEVDNYNYSVFLSFLHFAFTALGTKVMLHMNYFTYNEAPLSGILPVAIGSLLSVAFMNLNLAYNSVGFYQVSSTFSLSYIFSRSFLINFLFYFLVIEISLHSIHFIRAICCLQPIS